MASENSNQLITFDIASQSLDAALVLFAKQSNMQVIYDSELVKLRRSPGVKGRYTVLEALRLLVGHDDLIPHYTGSGAITLKPSRVTRDVISLDALDIQAEPLIGGTSANRVYAQRVLNAVVSHLRSKHGDLTAAFKMDLALWLTAQGVVERVEVMQSDIDTETRSRVASSLVMLSVNSPPPPALPQPLRIRLTGKSPIK